MSSSDYLLWNIWGCIYSYDLVRFRWSRRWISTSYYYDRKIGNIKVSILVISVLSCVLLRWLYRHILSITSKHPWKVDVYSVEFVPSIKSIPVASYLLYDIWRLCVTSLPISLLIVVRTLVLHLIIFKSEIAIISHCLGLGHETMVYVVRLIVIFVYLPWSISNGGADEIFTGNLRPCNVDDNNVYIRCAYVLVKR